MLIVFLESVNGQKVCLAALIVTTDTMHQNHAGFMFAILQGEHRRHNEWGCNIAHLHQPQQRSNMEQKMSELLQVNLSDAYYCTRIVKCAVLHHLCTERDPLKAKQDYPELG